MSDVPVYVVANFTVHDADTYREYEKGFFPILKRHEGSFFTYDDNTLTFEGSDPREGRMVMFTFPSEAHAVAWRDLIGPDGLANGPFMHNGFSTDFIDVLAHYNVIGMQMINTNMDPRLRPGGRPQRLNITDGEAEAVEAFILTLTGENLYSDSKWSDPFVGVANKK